MLTRLLLKPYTIVLITLLIVRFGADSMWGDVIGIIVVLILTLLAWRRDTDMFKTWRREYRTPLVRQLRGLNRRLAKTRAERDQARRSSKLLRLRARQLAAQSKAKE